MIETTHKIGDITITNKLIDGVLYSSYTIYPHSKNNKVKYKIVRRMTFSWIQSELGEIYHTRVKRIPKDHVIVINNNCYLYVNREWTQITIEQ